MLGSNYKIILYAADGPEVPGAELIACESNGDRISLFGSDNPNRLPEWPTDAQSHLFNSNVIRKMEQLLDDKDLILLTGGSTHSKIASAFPGNIKCEPGVGYEGIITPFCAFESYAWMHWIYAKHGIKDGRWFDCVIPNYFDVEDFIFNSEIKKTYLLFLGRLIARKGPHIASQIAAACGMELVIAGAGGKQDGQDVLTPDGVIKNARYVGPVNIEARAKLLSEAYALICPTIYIEPFGGVVIEAMMSGTPVLTPDWGAFTETVKNGVSGFRFRTLFEAKEAVKSIEFLDRSIVRDYAVTNYSLSSIAPQFRAWFKRLESLWDEGWYQLK